MPKENFLNFATSQIAGSLLTTNASSFSVTTNTGSNFPASNFIVTIDAEILLITSRTGDVFTIGVRAFDGSSIAPHVVGATVQLCETAYTNNHLWSNVADTFAPDVPPAQKTLSSAGVLTGAASSFDTEFESQGIWALYPAPARGTTFTIGTTLKSHLLLNRYGVNDNIFYSAYAPFSQNAPFTATCKLSEAINFPQNGAGTTETHFFIADQSNPTPNGDTGNRMRIDVVTNVHTTTINGVQQINYGSRFVRASVNINNGWYQQSPLVPVSFGQTLYLRMVFDSNNACNFFLGDGYTYSLFCLHSAPFVPQSLGFQFLAIQNAPYYVSQTVAVDYVRVVPSVLLPFGN